MQQLVTTKRKEKPSQLQGETKKAQGSWRFIDKIGGRLSEIATVAKSHMKTKRVKDHHGLKEYT
eukprot:7030447-Ditylum_brightwellii.AAC.1